VLGIGRSVGLECRIGQACGRAHPPTQGALAQLVARFHGMEEVRGSSPLSSTYYFLWSGAKRIGVISALCLVLIERGGQIGGLAGLLVRLEEVIHRLRAAP
jgi:hypothetical protein